MALKEVTLCMRGVRKAYPRLLACNDVDLDLRAGEVQALLGENGAGKTTIVGMLAGQLQPDSGEITLNGRTVRIANPRAARSLGIGFVHQKGTLIENLTVDENLALGRRWEHANGATRFKADVMAELGPRQVWDLGPWERAVVEVHRVLRLDLRVLVLDEPTASLSPQEAILLISDLRELARGGPWLDPVIAGNRPVVFVDLSVTLLPVVELPAR